MSFIGPRPDRLEVYSARCAENPLYACRTKVKAGMIGYTQVYGKYNSSVEERLNLDLEYIQNYSLWLDVQLFIFTGVYPELQFMAGCAAVYFQFQVFHKGRR